MSLAIHWFRQDLRLDDQDALWHALEHHSNLVPLFILDPDSPAPLGAASRWWLHHSLKALDEALRKKGSRLILRRGAPGAVLEALIRQTGAKALTWSRRYDPAGLAEDLHLKSRFRAEGLAIRSFNGLLLREPWTHLKADGSPFRVFTPFFKGYLNGLALEVPRDCPLRLPVVPQDLDSEPLEALGLLPKIPWDLGFRDCWQPGESGALSRSQKFLGQAVFDYRSFRDYPDRPGTSCLSPHLHFGEISPRRLLQQIYAAGDPDHPGLSTFLKEIGWREFGYSLLYHFPKTLDRPLDSKFDAFPWDNNPWALKAWQQGQTGYPIIDAGMRELWHTGWMHNRVRMIVASFLTKNLLIPWQQGAAWFWDTLVDADLASNTLGWQWTAGCGADAAPYFRVFNPVLQGERFDPEGRYVRRWVPELDRVPAEWIHRPFERSPTDRLSAGLRLGENYPEPLVDLAVSRTRALEIFAALRQAPDAGA